MTGYLPIPTYGRIKDPAITDATGKTVRAATTRMVQTGGRGMAMPGSSAGTSAGTSSGGMMPSAPSMDSTGTSSSGALEYDTTGIGYDHYHDALVNQSGGMGPDGRYQSGFLAGKTQEEARKFSADQWQAHNKAGTAQKMIQNLARVYGTPKQPQAGVTTPTIMKLPMPNSAAPRPMPLTSPAGQSQPTTGQSPASQVMAKLGMPAPSAPTAPGAGVLKPSASTGVLPSPRRSNDDALARRLKAQSGNPNATVMENGKAVTTANGTVQPMANPGSPTLAKPMPPQKTDPLMQQALQAAATGLDNAKTLMANRPAPTPQPQPQPPAVSQPAPAPAAKVKPSNIAATVLPKPRPSPLQPGPVERTAPEPLSAQDSAAVQDALNRDSNWYQTLVGARQAFTPGHNPSASQIPASVRPYAGAPATYPAPYDTRGANATVRNAGDNAAINRAAQDGAVVLTRTKDEYGNPIREYGVAKPKPAIMKTLEDFSPRPKLPMPRKPSI